MYTINRHQSHYTVSVIVAICCYVMHNDETKTIQATFTTLVLFLRFESNPKEDFRTKHCSLVEQFSIHRAIGLNKLKNKRFVRMSRWILRKTKSDIHIYILFEWKEDPRGNQYQYEKFKVVWSTNIES